MVQTELFGDVVKRERMRRGWSVRRLASVAKLNPQTVHDVEKNLRGTRDYTIGQICRALGIQWKVEREEILSEWIMLAQEARKRRKKGKMTQADLSERAGTSIPTVIRLEKGKMDMYVSSAYRIFGELGMVKMTQSPQQELKD